MSESLWMRLAGVECLCKFDDKPAALWPKPTGKKKKKKKREHHAQRQIPVGACKLIKQVVATKVGAEENSRTKANQQGRIQHIRVSKWNIAYEKRWSVNAYRVT